MQTDRQVYQLEIQKLNSEIGNLRAKLNSYQANQGASAVPTTPQASATVRPTDIGLSSSQVSAAVSEVSRHISPGVMVKVFATYPHAIM
jgi:hypothetical protein